MSYLLKELRFEFIRCLGWPPCVLGFLSAIVYRNVPIIQLIAGLHVNNGSHVGGQEQKLSLPLGTKLYFHVNSSRQISIVLTPNIAALLRGCKPRIEQLRANRVQSDCTLQRRLELLFQQHFVIKALKFDKSPRIKRWLFFRVAKKKIYFLKLIGEIEVSQSIQTTHQISKALKFT